MKILSLNTRSLKVFGTLLGVACGFLIIYLQHLVDNFEGEELSRTSNNYSYMPAAYPNQSPAYKPPLVKAGGAKSVPPPVYGYVYNNPNISKESDDVIANIAIRFALAGKTDEALKTIEILQYESDKVRVLKGAASLN